ncbi:GPP34 family phosphoprotein [Micromonospora sp. C31]|uniref:GOLPH3/VPS74 family protein n=1 Tax=Micromonospora sp. C31 TaxID=2824876 RepID=UPI001FFCA8F3|nr:GPP34 family phosphoprotein [Micromonospora sp. C31]
MHTKGIGPLRNEGGRCGVGRDHAREGGGDPLLGATAALLAGPGYLRVSRLAKDLPEQVLDGLVTAGVLRRDADKVLWVFPRTRYPSSTGAEPAVETQARQRMVAAVAGDGPVDARTAALIGLARAVGLDRELFAELPKQHVKRRLAEIAASDWASAATRKAIKETQAAVLIATTTATTAAIVTTTTS